MVAVPDSPTADTNLANNSKNNVLSCLFPWIRPQASTSHAVGDSIPAEGISISDWSEPSGNSGTCNSTNRFQFDDEFFCDDSLSLDMNCGNANRSSSKRVSTLSLLDNGLTETSQMSIFKEAEAMLTVCDLIYTFTAIRIYARRSENQALMETFALPQFSAVLVPALIRNVQEHMDHFKPSAEVDGLAETAMKAVNPDELIMSGNISGARRYSSACTNVGAKNSEVYYSGDTESDIEASSVYSININRSRERITVVFRGTTMDQNESGAKAWMTNLNDSLRWEENPVEANAEEVPQINLHEGFARASAHSRRNILRVVNEIRDSYPETSHYPLFVTGHSLGGALATLFGYYAANNEEVTKHGPVCVYSFASPATGDENFAKSVRYLEKSGKLMIARFWNSGDVVASIHEVKNKLTHVGVAIELDSSAAKMLNEERSKLSVGGLAHAFTNPGELLKKHSTASSSDFLDKHECSLKNVTLNDLYNESTPLHKVASEEPPKRTQLGTRAA